MSCGSRPGLHAQGAAQAVCDGLSLGPGTTRCRGGSWDATPCKHSSAAFWLRARICLALHCTKRVHQLGLLLCGLNFFHAVIFNCRCFRSEVSKAEWITGYSVMFWFWMFLPSSKNVFNSAYALDSDWGWPFEGSNIHVDMEKYKNVKKPKFL